jgi:hypothetical protein
MLIPSGVPTSLRSTAHRKWVPADAAGAGARTGGSAAAAAAAAPVAAAPTSGLARRILFGTPLLLPWLLLPWPLLLWPPLLPRGWLVLLGCCFGCGCAAVPSWLPALPVLSLRTASAARLTSRLPLRLPGRGVVDVAADDDAEEALWLRG